MGTSRLPRPALLRRQASRPLALRPLNTMWFGKAKVRAKGYAYWSEHAPTVAFWKETLTYHRYKTLHRRSLLNPVYAYHYYRARRQMRRDIAEYQRTHQGLLFDE